MLTTFELSLGTAAGNRKVAREGAERVGRCGREGIFIDADWLSEVVG